ncbi:MAG: type I restriction enzyme HsdR N-terminal domain-containing protein [Flavobacteriales bacterium]
MRRRWVALTPEEWVRQHFLNHLVHGLQCPLPLLSVERSLVLNGLAKRADIVINDAAGAPVALVECKAPSVPIGQAAFEQAARYNKVFQVPYLFITNGLTHFCCIVDHQQGTVRFLKALPTYKDMCRVPRP